MSGRSSITTRGGQGRTEEEGQRGTNEGKRPARNERPASDGAERRRRNEGGVVRAISRGCWSRHARMHTRTRTRSRSHVHSVYHRSCSPRHAAHVMQPMPCSPRHAAHVMQPTSCSPRLLSRLTLTEPRLELLQVRKAAVHLAIPDHVTVHPFVYHDPELAGSRGRLEPHLLQDRWQ